MKNYLIICICLFFGLLQAQSNYQIVPDKPKAEVLYDAMEWRSIGPFRGGRSCAVAGVPGRPKLFYFGAAGGGVWRTKDGGTSWQNISDGFFGGSIGSIAIAPSDQNVIYVGGGEKTLRGNMSSGYGVWKSEDAGKSWKHCGLSQSRHISRLRVDPKDHNIVFAAVMGNAYKDHEERGVFKSTNGGKTWKKVLYANAAAGAVDLSIDPSNARIMYASTWNVRRTAYSFSSGGEGSALWKSVDGGENWKNISDNEGLPKGVLGIIGVTVSPVNSERIWAIIESEKGGVFRSDDGGGKWIKINDERKLRQRAWYYSRIYADTEDADMVYVLNVRYHKSSDGGKTYASKNAPHGDHHDLWIDPKDHDRMIIGDDGGAQVSFDGGETWSTYHNQATAQFYRVTTDNDFPFRIYVAQQDNSTLRIQHRSGSASIRESHWERTAGCECGHIAIDPQDNDIVYGGCYDGMLQRKNHSKDQTRLINVWPDNPMGYGAEGMKYRFQWNFPLFFSPHDPEKLYTASNHLHVSKNEGQSWEIISPDLTRNDSTKLKSSGGPITQDNTSVEYYCTIFAAAESPRVKDLLWVGSDDGLVHVSRNGGKDWKNITPRNLPEWAMINSIEPDPHHDGGCYIAATSYKSGDFSPHLYKTKDYGASWTRINNGIKAEHFTRVIRVDPDRKQILYAGTESGIYISYNDGAQWESLQMNLPVVPITDLAVKDGHLIAATQGRSIWILDDLNLLHQASKKRNLKSDYLFKPKAAYDMPGSQRKKIKDAGINHIGGVGVYFYLAEDLTKEDSLEISFYEADGDLIRTFSNQAKKKSEKLKAEQGSNLFVWNMRYPDAKKFEGMILWWASMNGPKALPGEYKVQLKLNGKSQEQTFEILKDPRVEATDEDMKERFDFIIEIRDLLTEAHDAIIDIRDVRKQLNNFKSRMPDDSTYNIIREEMKLMDSTMTAVEKSLYQTKNKSRQDPLNFPIKLTNKLGHLNSLTGAGYYKPTDQAVAVKDELKQRIQSELKQFYEIKNSGLQELNKLIRTAEVDAILLPKKE